MPHVNSEPLTDVGHNRDTFKKIYVEVTNHCNLSCSFCHTSNRPRTSMTLADFGEILRKIKDYTRFIYLHVLGEAMLHPQFELLLLTSHRQDFQVNLSTNGTLLRAKTDLLLNSPSVRQINISLHSFTRAEGPALADYMTEILLFIRQYQERKSTIWLNLRLWDILENHDRAADCHRREILQQLQVFFSLPQGFADGRFSGRGLRLARGIFLSQERRFDWPHGATAISGSQGTCRGLHDHIAILVDGTVVPCCLDAEADIALGNIHHQGLEEILLSPRACRMRSGFCRRHLVEPLCRRCNYRKRFH
jgi:radical SAM protein with 4Fe4S-binding SPASM domain